MKKAFQYRAVINKQTETNCNEWLERCRLVYNFALDEKIRAYKETGKTISMYEQKKKLPILKQQYPEYKKVGSQVLQDVLIRLDKAYKAFFRRVKEKKEKVGFPRFKGKNRYDSFTLLQAGWQLKGRYLYIKNVGRFKLFLSRPIKGKIKTVTVRKASTGKWFVSFSCDDVPKKEYNQPIHSDVGIDVGLKEFCTPSIGEPIKNHRYLEGSLKELRRKYRSLSRKEKGSNRRNKARILVAKAHEKVANQRKDFCHKTANYFVENFANIYVEDLKIKQMTKNKYLSRSIADASWGQFLELMSYKAEEAGRLLIKVNPKNTSQKCSGCGKIVKKSLAVRVHKCHHCGLVIDRDRNASINILKLGQSCHALTSAVVGGV